MATNPGECEWDNTNSSENRTFIERDDGCDENKIVSIMSSVFFFLTFISSIVGNSLVIGSLIKFRQLRSKHVNFLVGSLAVSNMLVIGLVPFEFFRVYDPQTSRNVTLCLVYFTIVVALMGSGGGNFLIISFERFIAVMLPLQHRSLLTRTKLVIMIACVWILSVSFAVLSLFSWNKQAQRQITSCISYCTVDAMLTKEYRQLLVALGIIFLLANMAMFIPVVYVACRKSKDVNKKYLTRLLAYTFSIFSVAWCPFWVFTATKALADGPKVKCADQWSVHLGIFHSGIDWLVYGLGNKNFRQAFKQLIPCCHEKKRLRLEKWSNILAKFTDLKKNTNE